MTTYAEVQREFNRLYADPLTPLDAKLKLADAFIKHRALIYSALELAATIEQISRLTMPVNQGAIVTNGEQRVPVTVMMTADEIAKERGKHGPTAGIDFAFAKLRGGGGC